MSEKTEKSDKSEKTSFFKKKQVKRLLIIAFVILNIAIIAWTAGKELSRDSSEEIADTHVTWWLLLIAVVNFVIALGADIYKYYMLVHHFTKKKDVRLAAQTVLIGRYYDNITPSAIGGQPFQILHMRKNGKIDTEHAAMIPVIGFVSLQSAFVLLSLLTIIFGANIVLSDAIYAASYFGLFLYALAPALIIFFAVKPKFAKKLALGVLNFLHKIHIVRDIKKVEEKTLHEIESYAGCIRRVIKNKKLLAKVMGLSLAYQLFLYSIPFLVVTAFGGTIDYFAATMTAIAIQTAISFIPTPGNAGAAEGSFYIVFAKIGAGSTFWPMLIWRFFTYYAFIALGGLTYLEMAWRKKKLALNAGTAENSTI